MGGAAKHMMHPYDNLDITFGELADFITRIAFGNIDAVEKVDGVNIHWRIHRDGMPRFAQNITEIKKGGLNLQQLKQKLHNHPGRKQFIAGCEAIQYRALNGMRWCGNRDGAIWINTEIISATHPQCLKYDHDALVYHDCVSLNSSQNRMVSCQQSNLHFWNIFITHEIFSSIKNPWKLYHKLPIYIPSRPSEIHVTEALTELEYLRNESNCDFDDPILKYYMNCTVQHCLELGINLEHANQISENVWTKGKYRIKEIRKNYPDVNRTRLDRISLSKHRQGYQGECKKYFRDLFDRFGSKVIEPIASNLITAISHEQNRLDRLIEFNIVHAEEAQYKNNQEIWNRLINQLNRFNSLNVKCPVIEGIVILFNDQLYKLTGAFPSMNRVCGIARYLLNLKFEENHINSNIQIEL